MRYFNLERRANLGAAGHGQLQGPRSPRELFPVSWDLVDGKVLALARHPQEQKLRLHSARQQILTATTGDY
ncbi:hypothetical protein AMECASPLE_037701 [Ameca splendens]|uniref:Uncharacterized protein n=1 Tax=Ameca splendens TaxID=208324 RepID=A0ABV0ZVP6_9TELE